MSNLCVLGIGERFHLLGGAVVRRMTGELLVLGISLLSLHRDKTKV